MASPDIWASPLMTFGSGAGDCEDYAIAKYVALREAGMASADLRLVVVYNRPAHENHMVAAARVDGRWRILDNRTMRLVADEEIADYAPLAVLDSADGAPAVAAAPSLTKQAQARSRPRPPAARQPKRQRSRQPNPGTCPASPSRCSSRATIGGCAGSDVIGYRTRAGLGYFACGLCRSVC